MMTNNDKLPNETLVEIFNHIMNDTNEYMMNKPIDIKDNEIYKYFDDCDTCIVYKSFHNGDNPFETNDLRFVTDHTRRHKQTVVKQRINKRCKTSRERYEVIYTLTRTCRNWRQAYKDQYTKAMIDRRNVQQVTDMLVNYTVQEPQIITLKRTSTNDIIEVGRVADRYSRSSNILLINSYYREKYYKKVVQQESLKLRHKCKICNKEVDNEFNEDSMLPRRITDYEHKKRCSSIAYPTEKITYKINKGIIEDWICRKGCYKHCLNYFNHCNKGIYFTRKQIMPQEYIEWRNETFPKELKD